MIRVLNLIHAHLWFMSYIGHETIIFQEVYVLYKTLTNKEQPKIQFQDKTRLIKSRLKWDTNASLVPFIRAVRVLFKMVLHKKRLISSGINGPIKSLSIFIAVVQDGKIGGEESIRQNGYCSLNIYSLRLQHEYE